MIRGSLIAIAIAVALAIALGCGGSEKGGGGSSEPGGGASEPTDPNAPPRPMTESECQTFMDHVINLIRQEEDAKARAVHEAKQKARAEEATARGEPAPEPEPFDEKLLYTDEDADKARREFKNKFLKDCLKSPRPSVECGMRAKSAGDLRQC